MRAETAEPDRTATGTKTIGLVGARGYVGLELLSIIDAHPNLELGYASSRSLAGDPIETHADVSLSGKRFENIGPEEIAERHADILVLALPDQAAGPFVDALERSGLSPELIIDLSSDYRFDESWTYALPEHNADEIRGARKISNPGCYATAAQLLVRPILPMLDGVPHCFGVSGYSGAGTKPSPRNDPDQLNGGVLPYKLVNHTHEREVSRHLGAPVRFSPHVAPYFRGITLTLQAKLNQPITDDLLCSLYRSSYEPHALVEVIDERVPRVQDIVTRDGAVIGGISVNPDRPEEIAAVCTIDNLRKGAATQAVQNINISLGFDEHAGLNTDPIGASE